MGVAADAMTEHFGNICAVFGDDVAERAEPNGGSLENVASL
jgi:hypothetical protein